MDNKEIATWAAPDPVTMEDIEAAETDYYDLIDAETEAWVEFRRKVTARKVAHDNLIRLKEQYANQNV